MNNGLKNQETVSFELKGNTLRFGTWEHGNYQTTTNAESYLFYGKKVGNKLFVTFTRTVPYTIPNKATEAVWTLNGNRLSIPMVGKNHNTNKFETTVVNFDGCASVEADDTAEAQADTPCSCEAYVIDTDQNGLNVRQKGDKNAAVVTKIPFDKEGVLVTLDGSNGKGWVSLSEGVNMRDKVMLTKKGYVFAQKLGISVAGYEQGKVDVYAAPSRSSAKINAILAGNDVVVLDCKGNWMKVKYADKGIEGWLRHEDQCPNPVTTCN